MPQYVTCSKPSCGYGWNAYSSTHCARCNSTLHGDNKWNTAGAGRGAWRDGGGKKEKYGGGGGKGDKGKAGGKGKGGDQSKGKGGWRAGGNPQTQRPNAPSSPPNPTKLLKSLAKFPGFSSPSAKDAITQLTETAKGITDPKPSAPPQVGPALQSLQAFENIEGVGPEVKALQAKLQSLNAQSPISAHPHA